MELGKTGITILVVLAILAAVAVTVFVYTQMADEPSPPGPLQDLPLSEVRQSEAFDLVRSMGVGWNLGNTLDSLDNRNRSITGDLPQGVSAEVFYETYWGNPVTTFEMIQSVAEMGFGAVRVPVTWNDHMDENFNISQEWLERVEQVVNYVLDNDMYCIINIHHDVGSGSWPWLRADPANIEWMEEHLKIVWTQIAEFFRDYCDRLIFESFNEILDVDSNWTQANSSALGAVNRLNQAFVDTVRGTGGNNAERFLVVKTYGARRYEWALRDFVIPQDSAIDRLIVGVHFYGTHGFTRQQEQVPWTTAYSQWDYHRNGGLTVEVMTLLRETFVANGIPVIIAEFGAQNKNNTIDRIRYAEHFIQAAGKYGIACFWWDNGGRAESSEDVLNYALFDRHNNKWFFPEIAEAMISAAS